MENFTRFALVIGLFLYAASPEASRASGVCYAPVDPAVAMAQLRTAEHLPSEHVEALIHALELREANRQAIRSLEAAFSQMFFASPAFWRHMELFLAELDADRSYPVQPYPREARLNPQVRNIHFIQQGPSTYVRSYHTSHAVKSNPANQAACGASACLYAPVETRQEFVDIEGLQFSENEAIVLASTPRSERSKSSTFSKEGALPVPIQDFYSPHVHETIPLEDIVSMIADRRLVLEDVSMGSHSDGRRILSLAFEYEDPSRYWRENSRLTYSLDDNGLLLHGVSLALQQKPDGGLSTRIISWSDIAFHHHVEEDGTRIVVPLRRLWSVAPDGELHNQYQLIVDEDSLRINDDIPEEAFALTDAIPAERRPSSVFRTVARFVGIEDRHSNVKRFPMDEVWMHKLLHSFSGADDSDSPYGKIALAKYVRHPMLPNSSATCPNCGKE